MNDHDLSIEYTLHLDYTLHQEFYHIADKNICPNCRVAIFRPIFEFEDEILVDLHDDTTATKMIQLNGKNKFEINLKFNVGITSSSSSFSDFVSLLFASMIGDSLDFSNLRSYDLCVVCPHLDEILQLLSVVLY